MDRSIWCRPVKKVGRKGEREMKKVIRLSCAILIFSMLILTQGCGPGKYVPRPDEELYGTWANENVSPQKAINAPGGYKQYRYLSDPAPIEEGTEQIAARWTDAVGNIFYKTFGTVTAGASKGYKWQSLQKIGKSGSVLEAVDAVVREFEPGGYPVAIDPKDTSYRLYFRTKN